MEKHNVELYHLSALALYKFDYLIRSGKVDRSRVIFRFYALYALIRKHWGTPDILDASPKSQKKVKDSVASVLNDNDAFSAHIEEVSGHLKNLTTEADITSREKIRDYIRSESVVDEFTQRLFPK